MELIYATPFSGSMKRYWRRRQYQRLDVNRGDRRVIRLGGKKRRNWRIKVIRRLVFRFKIVSPIKLLAKLRDAYITMMFNLARNVGSLNGETFFSRKGIQKARGGGRQVSKAEQIENKLILEIHKALKASRELDST